MRVNISFTMDIDLAQKLEQYCNENNKPKSHIITEALTKYFEEVE